MSLDHKALLDNLAASSTPHYIGRTYATPADGFDEIGIITLDLSSYMRRYDNCVTLLFMAVAGAGRILVKNSYGVTFATVDLDVSEVKDMILQNRIQTEVAMHVGWEDSAEYLACQAAKDATKSLWAARHVKKSLVFEVTPIGEDALKFSLIIISSFYANAFILDSTPITLAYDE